MPSPSSPSDFWDDKFSRPGYLYGVEPNSWLVSQRYRLKTGMRVLCVGDGEGRNGVWLAQQGMEVMSVDSSPVALRKSMKLAMDRNTKLMTHCADLVTWHWPREAYDAVVAIFLHFPPTVRPAIHVAMAGALRPGGILLMEAFRPEQIKNGAGGPRNPSLLYTPDTLRTDFEELTIEELAAWDGVLDEGPGHQGQSATTRLVARKPK
ncbi:class I SAM-dependent methyltransferase [Rhodospirillum sp. A1_3_36]|uniref:class I SAM-dependent methyltransferase n=1 Tax=Rhodospirillum sp. A1_3_36 TaxID=3391666 RepID=UPI0039A71848